MSLVCRTDVTAVKFYKTFILAGIGSFINIFDKKTFKLLHRIELLNGQKIYGFVVSKVDDKILVFGGKQFTVVASKYDGFSVTFHRLFEPVTCDDWLHSAAWIDEEKVALLTAHNIVQKWNTSNRQLSSCHPSKDNSILYSGLLIPVLREVVVLAGTVFSEVIIHQCGEETALHHLKGHRGVIFSISCEPNKGFIATTSDDRSMRIWLMERKTNHPIHTIDFWKNITIECKHEVYGHSARVMRSFMANEFIVSIGEDGAICFWNYDGSLRKKIGSQQTGSLWCLDADNEHLVIGGGDSGINLYPFTVATDYSRKEVLDIPGTPKNIAFTAKNNIVILNDCNELIYYDVAREARQVIPVNHSTTYRLLSVSPCRQIVAVSDMGGQLNVFVENLTQIALIHYILDVRLNIGKILSMHWAGNRHLLFCSETGDITVLTLIQNKIEVYAKFTLPPCKERWLTSCAMDNSTKMIVCGDRCGNLHCFVKSQRNPIKTFRRVHGSYGATSMTVRNNEITTTGRDGTIKYFSIKEDVTQSKYKASRELGYEWIERFVDKNETLISGFHERVFVIHNIKTNKRVIEFLCGGGHRCWDAIRCFNKVNDVFEEFIKMISIQNSSAYLVTFQMSKIVSKSIVNGSHTKQINCLNTFKLELNSTTRFYITGSEDTTLRISSLDANSHFQDELIYKHLSNVKTLKICTLQNNQLLVVSGGGRAQICINLFIFEKVNHVLKVSVEELTDYLLKGDDHERKRNRMWRNPSLDFNPETRIMDLEAIQITETKFLIFAGCSDTYLRVFIFVNEGQDVQFRPIKEIDYHNMCILKIQQIKMADENLLATCTTRGEIAFWHIIDTETEFDIKLIFTFRTRTCGINCIAHRILSNTLLIATGGDDNAVSLNLLEIGKDDSKSHNISITELHKWSSDRFHCSQISGILLIDDVLISASIDQRVTVCRWEVNKDGIQCEFLTQVFSDIADIQGLDLLEYTRESATVCVFGKGMEVLKISIPNKT